MSARFALVIANTEYDDPGLAKLSAPGKDAEGFAHILKDPNLCGFNEVNVLLNQPESVIREKVDEFFSQKKPDDMLVLYFSGHGIRDDIGALYLAVKNTNRFRLRSTAIKSDFIREAMDQSRSKRQILILDCCNSGAFAQGTKAATGVSIGTFTAFEGTGYGRIVLTASDATQFAWEGDKFVGETENSLFTHYLIKGLEGEADRNGDGTITVDELYDYVYEKIVTLTPKQTPGKWSFKEQGEIILRDNIQGTNKATQTGRLRRELVEQAKRFRTDQDSLLQEKAKLEEKLTGAPATTRTSRNWVWIAGISALFVVVFGVFAIGYWILSSLSTKDSPSTAEPTVDSSMTDAPVSAPTDVTLPEDISFMPATEILSEYLSNVQVLDTDTFDDPNGNGWIMYVGSIQSGFLEILGSPDWGGVARARQYKEGEGIVVDLDYSDDSVFELFFESGDWQTDSYRRFGIYVESNNLKVNEWTGREEHTPIDFSGTLTPTSDTTYSLLMAMLPGGEFLAVMWDPANPSETLSYREKFDQTWSGLDWNFYIQVGSGTTRFDNFMDVQFSGAN